jgi:hypothetical protein
MPFCNWCITGNYKRCKSRRVPKRHRVRRQLPSHIEVRCDWGWGEVTDSIYIVLLGSWVSLIAIIRRRLRLKIGRSTVRSRPWPPHLLDV